MRRRSPRQVSTSRDRKGAGDLQDRSLTVAARSESQRRRVCFVTGTRAEFGLMRSVLEAIRAHPKLQLQIIATGMHLDRRHGRTLDEMSDEWTVDAVAPWRAAVGAGGAAQATGLAIASLAKLYQRLKSDIVLVVGDRVEAFAAAAAGAISQIPVAHIHGGDRAIGQVDDSLRHAITKLAHVHLAATAEAAQRIRRLGEDRWRVHTVGAPGVDGIVRSAAPPSEVRRAIPQLGTRRFALLVLHPVQSDPEAERQTARTVLDALGRSAIRQIVAIYPNNDPGADGIIKCFRSSASPDFIVLRSAPRALFLGLMRQAAVLVGNSSSGIIEAASFHLPVVNIGPRQRGRLASENVMSVPVRQDRIAAAIARGLRWREAGRRFRNVYGGQGAGRRIASILSHLGIGPKLLRKLITY
ncbi:MAG: UDP-N-acetylglucosamine 2-epimerase [Planctomycetes bacterium]|nr:UDP-N-acetylglucosamine 2-epimerase [Planctomycetota bacterium]